MIGCIWLASLTARLVSPALLSITMTTSICHCISPIHNPSCHFLFVLVQFPNWKACVLLTSATDFSQLSFSRRWQPLFRFWVVKHQWYRASPLARDSLCVLTWSHADLPVITPASLNTKYKSLSSIYPTISFSGKPCILKWMKTSQKKHLNLQAINQQMWWKQLLLKRERSSQWDRNVEFFPFGCAARV